MLKNSCLSNFDSNIYSNLSEWERCKKESPVIIQWDPERDLYLRKLNFKTIQIGLSGIAVENYINKWIVNIKDITPMVRIIYQDIQNGNLMKATSDLPFEKIYPIDPIIGAKIGHS